MIARRMHGHERRQSDAVAMEMTPMIDVVFQLLIFFLFAVQQRDILAVLPVARPQAAPGDAPVELSIQVCKPAETGEEVFRFRGQPMPFQRLSADLARIASHDPRASVIVRCEADSSHSALVRLLDVCSKSKLTNVAVFSAREDTPRGQE
jgi:biopolymer transport protein ExbD